MTAELADVLYRFALRATSDPDLARDLAQETMLVVVSDGATFAGRSSQRTWAVGILSHKIADHFRRRAVRKTDSDEAALLRTPSSEDVERVVSARQELGRVARALGKLDERERLVLMLVDVEGVDRAESCRILDVSATHLRVLVHRARNRLRRLLEGNGHL